MSGSKRSGTHRCPAHGCVQLVPSHQLMCPGHWRMVSPNLQRRLYAAYDHGRGTLSDAHLEAIRLCEEDVNSKLANAGEVQ